MKLVKPYYKILSKVNGVEILKNIELYGRTCYKSEDEITEDSALIRELHVYGPAAAIGKKGIIQHKGIGKALLKQAEKIAKTYHKDKMIIISGKYKIL